MSDLVSIENHYLIEYEIKRSWEDFLADFKKQTTHFEGKVFKFYYVVPQSIVDKCDEFLAKYEWPEPYTKEQVDEMLKKYNITLENNVGHDYCFVANMGKADYLKSSIPDEQHLAMYVKDVIDDPDAGDGVTMRRWYATMVANGEIVEWSEMM